MTGTPIGERINTVPKAIHIVEYKSHLCEVCRSVILATCCWDCVEPIAVCRYVCRGPSMACQPSPGNENLIPEVGSASAIHGTKWRTKNDIAAEGLRTRYAIVGIGWVGPQDLLHDTFGPCLLGVFSC